MTPPKFFFALHDLFLLTPCEKELFFLRRQNNDVVPLRSYQLIIVAHPQKASVSNSPALVLPSHTYIMADTGKKTSLVSGNLAATAKEELWTSS